MSDVSKATKMQPMPRVIPALACLLLILPIGQSRAEENTTVHPKDTRAALENPGMGWVLYYYSNIPTNYGSRLKPSDTVDEFPGVTTVYLRIPWGYLEPEEGKFRWSILDTPAARWIAKGKKIALRLTCSESWMQYATPKWVRDAGAKGHAFTVGKGVDPNGPFWEPDYKDPVFLEKLENFLAAVAKRYDGNPEVAFIDIGTYGVWGEGHTWASSRIEYPLDTKKIHVDLHHKHFKNSLVAICDDFAGPEVAKDQALIDYAFKLGMTLRDDSILVQPKERAYFHAAMAGPFWPVRPVVLEHEHYGSSKSRGNWEDGRLLLKAVEEYHASYLSIHWWPHEFLEANRALIDQINLRLGYRVQLAAASWPKRVKLDEPVRFQTTWQNAGVAPCLPGGFPCLTLKDSQGGIVAVLADDSLDVRQLEVGEPGKSPKKTSNAALQLPLHVEPGTYDVFFSVGTRTGTPTIALPHREDDGQRRYRMGTLEITR